MSAVDQCSRCDAVYECVAGNITSLEDVAGVIGCPTPPAAKPAARPVTGEKEPS